MASPTLKPPGIFSMFQGRESTHGYYSIRQNLLCYELGPRPDLTGGRNEGYHVYHGGLPLLLAATPAMAVDCAAIRAACVERCTTVTGGPAQQKNCANRCSISSCQQTPLAARTCDANAQTICSSSFRSCSDACTTSFAATAATIQAQASCTTSRCTKSSCAWHSVSAR